MWDRNPDVESVQFGARDDETPSTQTDNWGGGDRESLAVKGGGSS